jgi:hypothetical protein
LKRGGAASPESHGHVSVLVTKTRLSAWDIGAWSLIAITSNFVRTPDSNVKGELARRPYNFQAFVP